MVKFISKSELDSKKSDNKKSHMVGEIYPQIFSHDGNIDFTKDIKLEAGIIWLGGYKLDSSLFPKEKCPVCGKEEVLIPYKTVGSILSGCHTISFYCTNCNEQFITNSHIEYFRKIYKYILENKKNFTPEQKLGNCTSSPEDAEYIRNSS
jgi:hypothetical protein